MQLYIERLNREMQIHSFIFNWPRQYEKAKQKEEQLSKIDGLKVTVINSDDAVTDYEPEWINIGNDAYFTAQFLMALKLFQGDILFHVQADASYNNWQKLIDDALMYHEKYMWGIYAPNVDYTWYDSSKTDINNIKLVDDNLKMVACPDCTCWFIDKNIIEDFHAANIEMEKCKMGWGWDIILPAFSFLKARPVIRDYNHTIDHPRGTNYNSQQAELEMYDLYNKLPFELQTLFRYIKGHRENIARYFGV